MDPLHGDDTLAEQLNPFGSASQPNASRPLQRHPLALQLGITGELQQAGYAFRTVTAAVAWLSKLPIIGPATTPLPYTNPDNGEIVGHVVIHCMPGLYGPRDPATSSGQQDFDAASGLPWNGETFPIQLPDRVSIQGTSALDTIFDARGHDEFGLTGQSIFVFDNTGHTVDSSGSFIDSVTLRGCRYVGTQFSGAAVVLDGVTPLRPTISNCFVYGNDVGIVLFDPEDTFHHAPRIVNNTIAWNQIGIWSRGRASPLSPGTSRPVVLNNLIDPIRPVGSGLPGYFLGVGAATNEPPSCFEGLDAADLRASVGGSCNLTSNFNAYDTGHANLGNAWPFGATSPRTATALPAPVVALNPWNGSWNQGNPIRGDLYVRDVLATAGAGAAPHDFRLAPMTRDAGTGTQVLNRLVNQGMDLSSGTITFANGEAVATPPGIPGDDLATFNAFDFDCEGFGNDRIAARRIGQAAHFPTPWCESLIDLGADEMGELIVAGYLDSTRIFSRPHAAVAPNTASVANAESLYLLNVHALTGGGAPVNYIAPQFNFRGDLVPLNVPNQAERPEWYAQLGPDNNPFLVPTFDPAPPFAFTKGQDHVPNPQAVPCTRWMLTTAGLNPNTPFSPFMRTRVCDIGPHLLDDIAPTINPVARDVDYAEYDFLPPQPVAVVHDSFQANAWYDMVDANNSPDINDNVHLYIDGANTRLRHGTINPPMTFAGDPSQAAFPSSFLFRDPPRHPIGYWNPPGYTYTVGTNGLSPLFVLDALANVDWYGYRMNQELFDPDNAAWASLGSPNNNLQTFLVVQGDDGTGARAAAFASSSARSAVQMEQTRRTIESILIEAGRRLR